MEIFESMFQEADKALQVELIVRAVLFIFAFLGLAILFSSGLQSDNIVRGPAWRRTALKVAIVASYALAVINILMTVSWIVVFFFR